MHLLWVLSLVLSGGGKSVAIAVTLHGMEVMKFSRTLLYDPVLRVLHAWNGFFIVALLLTSAAADVLGLDGSVAGLWRLHVWLGYGLLLGVVGRMVWGVVGPARARWSVLWQLRQLMGDLRHKRVVELGGGDRPPPLAALFYLVSYGVLLLSVMTGLALVAIEFDSGPLRVVLGLAFTWGDAVKVAHELGEKWFYLFLLVHFAAMIWHERRDGVPVAQGMISGYHYRREDEDA